MRRIAIALSLVLIGGCDDAPDVKAASTASIAPTPPPNPVLSPDAQAVKDLRDHLGNIESTYDAASSAVLDVLNKAVLGQVDPSNRDSLNDSARTGMQVGAEILAQSLELRAPKIADPIVQDYVKSVVTAHKAWARALQSRDTAFFSADIEQAVHFKNLADAASSKEAANLILAYRQVGLTIQ